MLLKVAPFCKLISPAFDQVAVPALLRVRASRSLLAVPFTSMVAEAGILVEPMPLIVPPAHVKSDVIVRGVVPVRMPPERVAVTTVTGTARVVVPPDTLR